MINQFKKEYFFLSNFYPVEVFFRGRWYPSVEHAYQSAKSDDPSWKQECMLNDNPVEIKQNSKNVTIVPNWEKIKIDVMREVIKNKFEFPPSNLKRLKLNKMLLGTLDKEIVEGNHWGDTFWGVDIHSGVGENWLGKILMARRAEIKNNTEKVGN